MQIVRTIAVGLFISSFLIYKMSVEFIKWAIETSTYAFQMAWRTMSESSGHIAGVGLILPAVFIVLCLSFGLAIAGTFYPLLKKWSVKSYYILVERIVSYNKKHYG